MSEQKIIIRNQSDLPIGRVMEYVYDVIRIGRISDGEAYCYHTAFTRENGRKVHVAAKKNKASDTFTVWDEGQL